MKSRVMSAEALWRPRARAALLAAMLLTGCGEGDGDVPPGKLSSRSYVKVYTDPVTGCEYLAIYYGGSTGATPRLDTNGRPICRGGWAKEAGGERK